MAVRLRGRGDPSWFGDQAAGEGHIDVAGNDSVEEVGQPHPLQFDGYLRCFGGEQADQVGGEHCGPPEVQFGGYCHERFELTQLHVLTVP